jgi:hypothetical protein
VSAPRTRMYNCFFQAERGTAEGNMMARGIVVGLVVATAALFPHAVSGHGMLVGVPPVHSARRIGAATQI